MTTKISGWFDCRKYKKGTERNQRNLVADTEVITFNSTFAIAELPECFKNEDSLKYVHYYCSKDATDGKEDRASVSFKISKVCKWFDKYGKPCPRPTNEELDSVLNDGRFEVQIEYNVLVPASDAGDLAPRGYWANAIMYQKAVENPFKNIAFCSFVEPINEEPKTTQEENEDLPF